MCRQVSCVCPAELAEQCDGDPIASSLSFVRVTRGSAPRPVVKPLDDPDNIPADSDVGRALTKDAIESLMALH